MVETNLPWADTPFTLIPIPPRGQSPATEHESVAIARDMAFAHNGMLRCLNSIYQQCPYVKEPADIKDLLLYIRVWHDWIHEHHEAEEQILFPGFEEIAGIKGLMEKNVAQHEAFLPGLAELAKYAKETTVEEYDAMQLRKIIDRFGPILATHLTDEIQTLLDLRKFDGPALMKVYMKLEEEVKKADPVILSLELQACSTSTNFTSLPYTHSFLEVEISTLRMRIGLFFLVL
jgi:hemerythrin-like domain-containing protein